MFLLLIFYRRTLPLSTSPKCVSCRRIWRTQRTAQRQPRARWTKPVAAPVPAEEEEELGGRRQERSLGLYLLCTTDIILLTYCPQTPADIRTITQDSRVIINSTVCIYKPLSSLFFFLLSPTSFVIPLKFHCHWWLVMSRNATVSTPVGAGVVVYGSNSSKLQYVNQAFSK